MGRGGKRGKKRKSTKRNGTVNCENTKVFRLIGHTKGRGGRGEVTKPCN